MSLQPSIPPKTAGIYEGFDRFGRITNQTWYDSSGTPAIRDKFIYQYDYSSNRTVRQREGVSAPLDEQYFYDDLDRLKEYHRGSYDSDMGEIAAHNNDRQFGQEWTLSDTGNWNEFKYDNNGDDDYTDYLDLDQDRTFNLANNKR